MIYYAKFEPADEGGFVITFPGFEGATQGEDEADAIEMARDFLVCALYIQIRQGADIPAVRVHRGSQFRPIALPTLVAMKVELYRAFRVAGIQKVELARRMGIPKTNVDRLFDVRLKTSLSLIESAFAAIGKRLTVEIHDRAA